MRIPQVRELSAAGAVGVLVCLVLCGCSCAPVPSGGGPPDVGAPDVEAEIASLRARMVELREEITGLIGDAPCDSSADCRAIAFGTKPCGGPWSYRVYSLSYTDRRLLESKVQEHNELEARWNNLTGAISDCMAVGEPSVGCADGRCVQM